MRGLKLGSGLRRVHRRAWEILWHSCLGYEQQLDLARVRILRVLTACPGDPLYRSALLQTELASICVDFEAFEDTPAEVAETTIIAGRKTLLKFPLGS